LCDEGFLAQPHTSAGRIPTERGFRSYINSLVASNRMLTAELSRVRAELSRVETMEGRVELTSHILTEMSRGVGIVAAIPTTTQQLDQIELLSLGERRVLMIMVTRAFASGVEVISTTKERSIFNVLIGSLAR